MFRRIAPQVHLLLPSDWPAALVVLTAAFMDDPVFVWCFADPLLRVRVLRLMLREVLRDSIREQTAWGGWANGALAGVAVWAPPAQRLAPLTQWLHQGFAMFRMALIGGRGYRVFRTGVRALAAVPPPEPHWHLRFIGVAPAARRRGLGTALLASVHARADDERLSCWLETANRRALSFYQRAGYVVQADIKPFGEDAPRLLMLRRADTE